MVGQFISLTNKTVYEPTEEARQVLKSAFIAMRNYSNKYEWGVGISGRHPFGGSMKADDVAAFAYLALSGDLSGEGKAFDHYLAADYLRLCEKDTPEARYFKTQGITPRRCSARLLCIQLWSGRYFPEKRLDGNLKGIYH